MIHIWDSLDSLNFELTNVASDRMRLSNFLALAAVTPLMTTVIAGPVAYGICQSGCCAIAVPCYAAAGFVFVRLLRCDCSISKTDTGFQGTVTAGVGTPPALLACNSALGVCSAKCAAVALLPTP